MAPQLLGLFHLIHNDRDIARDVRVEPVPIALGHHTGCSPFEGVNHYTGSVGVHFFVQHSVHHLEDAFGAGVCRFILGARVLVGKLGIRQDGHTRGYRLVAYPLTLLAVAARAMEGALASLAAGEPAEGLLGFDALRDRVGFDAYDELQARYAAGGPDDSSG